MASLSSDKTIHTSLLLISAWIWLSSVSSLAELQHFQHPVKPDGSLNILVVGDWGRKGRYNQSEVAFQMGSVGQKLDIDFVISTGDNFYEDGLTGVDDPAFNESFTAIYTAPSLNKQWYNEFVEFFFVDTTPFVDKYFTHPGDDTYDWKGVYPREYYLSNLLKDMDEALKKSNAQWKIVVGHHTIKSAGNHGVTEELVEQLVPILEANTVDMYINGHDHCLEHIIESNSQIQYLTTGGGSKAWKGQIHPWDPEELKFYYDGQGFMSMQITQKSVYIAFYDIFGRVLHAWNISKEQYSSA
ncbi:purple acid phosphatase 8-like isoform X2 [Durio zibethinus]|uniref:Purple acid phosphatase n=1 Tax=Durio zibethinus TaxID=66656 RepID=A0A6P6BF34_DURZI|nr:purple acid phosphatase 8-like isoform X2 [Durio zibethinus]